MAVDKLVDSTQLDTDLTSVANAIRTKGGTSSQLSFPSGFVSAVQAIPTGTTPTGTKQISITQNGTTTEDVAQYASAEITVNVSGGGGGSVDDFLKGLWPSGNVTISEATTVRGGAFIGNTAITSASGNSVTTLGETTYTNNVLATAGCFMNCTGLVSVSFPNATFIGLQTFRDCSNLESVSLPKVVTLGPTTSSAGSYFHNCSKLTTLNLPSLTTVNGTYALAYIGSTSARVTIVLPKVSSFENNDSFRSSHLDALDLGPDLSLLKTRAFYMGSINTLILRKTNGVVACEAANSINDINSNTRVYVPSSLISSYEQDTNWGAKGSIFYAIEGSQYENYYADGTPISTT